MMENVQECIKGLVNVQFESGLEFFEFKATKNGPFFDIKMRSLWPLQVPPDEFRAEFDKVKAAVCTEILDGMRKAYGEPQVDGTGPAGHEEA